MYREELGERFKVSVATGEELDELVSVMRDDVLVVKSRKEMYI